MAIAEVWRDWLDLTIAWLQATKILRSIRPVSVSAVNSSNNVAPVCDRSWEKLSVEIRVSSKTYQSWIRNDASTGDEEEDLESDETRTLVQFSGNDYLGLSMHPAVRAAASQAVLTSGMGIRGSALICGYTSYHRQLETALARLKNTEECLLCPTGFSANMAAMTAISVNLPQNSTNKIAIFSDELNHASIIDGVRIAQKQNNSEVYIYKHNNMKHLENLLSDCNLERKVVVTDSLFSMDGDFAPLNKLVMLKEQHKFLLVIDDAHGTLVFGENGGGVAEAFGVEKKIDIYIGTLSKAFGCHGGFIATSRKWKLLIQSRGRSFVYSTALPIPVVSAAYTAILVIREERWRRENLWKRIKQFSELTGIEVQSPIIPIIIGGAEEALRASKEVLEAGFHVLAIRPPVVPPNSSRLRITLCASHTESHVRELCNALAPWLGSKTNAMAKL